MGRSAIAIRPSATSIVSWWVVSPMSLWPVETDFPSGFCAEARRGQSSGVSRELRNAPKIENARIFAGMSWGNRYLLPWAALRTDLIDSAVAEVTRRWPEITVERSARREPDGEHMSIWFHVPGALARKIELEGMARLFRIPGDLDEHWAQYGYDGADAVPIEIELDHYSARDGSAARTQLSFDTAHSGTGVCPGVATEIAELMGKFLGSSCEPG
jgi:hypothetical protein